MGKSAWEVDDDLQHEQRMTKQRAAAFDLLETFSDDDFKDNLKTLEVPQRFLDSLEDLRNWIEVNHVSNGN